MVVNGRVRQRHHRPAVTSDIETIIAEGEYYGMRTFDQALARLVMNGALELQQAMNAASNPHDFKVMLERAGVVSTASTYAGSFSH